MLPYQEAGILLPPFKKEGCTLCERLDTEKNVLPKNYM